MIKESIMVLCVILAIIGVVNCSIVVFEAGPYAIILDEHLETMEIGDVTGWQVFGFEPITSRELIKSNYYSLRITSLLEKDNAGVIGIPKFIEISEKPLEDIPLFVPKKVKEISVGRLRPINTTLWTGEINGKTPYFVNFMIDGFYCTVYDPDTYETSVTDFLKNLDIIKKEDLGKYTSELWTKED